jgi:hypothetical protein
MTQTHDDMLNLAIVFEKEYPTAFTEISNAITDHSKPYSRMDNINKIRSYTHLDLITANQIHKAMVAVLLGVHNES